MSSDKTAFSRYLFVLRKTSVDEKTEHTDRAALQSLLEAVADAGVTGVRVQHEPKRVAVGPFSLGCAAINKTRVSDNAIGRRLSSIAARPRRTHRQGRSRR